MTRGPRARLVDPGVVYVVGALFAGLALGILVVLPFALRRRRPEVAHDVVAAETFEAPAPPPAAPRPPLDQAENDPFGISRPTTPRPPPAAQPLPAAPIDGVPTEWAKRVTGPVEPGRVKGICSGCGTRISVTTQRPLRIACPVCGRTRLLT